MVAKASSRAGIILRSFHSKNFFLLKSAFNTFVRPILEYSSQVWSPHSQKHINDIENVQRRFTSRIASLKSLSYPVRLAILGMEPLEVRRLRADIILKSTTILPLILFLFTKQGLMSIYYSNQLPQTLLLKTTSSIE